MSQFNTYNPMYCEYDKKTNHIYTESEENMPNKYLLTPPDLSSCGYINKY